jgi:hypothetical protein
LREQIARHSKLDDNRPAVANDLGADLGHAPGEQYPRVRGDAGMYSPEVADKIIDSLARGLTLLAVCREPDMPAQPAVLGWVLQDHDGFAARYRQARELGSGRSLWSTPESGC